MAIIKKKTWPAYFEKVLSGEKQLEFRVADFPIAEGGELVLEEWDPKTKEYTGRSVSKKVGYVGTFTLDSFGAARAGEYARPAFRRVAHSLHSLATTKVTARSA